MLKNLTALLCVLLVVSCNTSDSELQKRRITASDSDSVVKKDSTLKSWWSFFGDPALDRLVSSALGLNAGINIQQKAFPEENVTSATLRAYYKDSRVSLVKDVVQDYIEYRYIQNQQRLLLNYIEEQQFILRGSGEEQVKVLEIELNALSERKDEFEMRLDKFSAKISSSTKLLPEYVSELLKKEQPIPFYDMTPVFLEDAHALLMRTSYIKAASVILYDQTERRISEEDVQPVFPNIPLNRLFGVSDQIFAKSESPWRVSVGMALRSLHFDDLETKEKYEKEVGVYRNAVFSYVLELERLLVGYVTLIEQSQLLKEAVEQAQDKDVYKARLGVLRAEYEKAKTVTALFDALDLY